jgi:hypothetical protein
MKNTNNNWEIRFGRIVDDKSKVICMLPKRDNNDIANLIIAAPDLLYALEFLLADYSAHGGILRTGSTIPSDIAKAAISKAYGR